MSDFFQHIKDNNCVITYDDVLQYVLNRHGKVLASEVCYGGTSPLGAPLYKYWWDSVWGSYSLDGHACDGNLAFLDNEIDSLAKYMAVWGLAKVEQAFKQRRKAQLYYDGWKPNDVCSQILATSDIPFSKDLVAIHNYGFRTPDAICPPFGHFYLAENAMKSMQKAIAFKKFIPADKFTREYSKWTPSIIEDAFVYEEDFWLGVEYIRDWLAHWASPIYHGGIVFERISSMKQLKYFEAEDCVVELEEHEIDDAAKNPDTIFVLSVGGTYLQQHYGAMFNSLEALWHSELSTDSVIFARSNLRVKPETALLRVTGRTADAFLTATILAPTAMNECPESAVNSAFNVSECIYDNSKLPTIANEQSAELFTETWHSRLVIDLLSNMIRKFSLELEEESGTAEYYKSSSKIISKVISEYGSYIGDNVYGGIMKISEEQCRKLSDEYSGQVVPIAMMVSRDNGFWLSGMKEQFVFWNYLMLGSTSHMSRLVGKNKIASLPDLSKYISIDGSRDKYYESAKITSIDDVAGEWAEDFIYATNKMIFESGMDSVIDMHVDGVGLDDVLA